MYFGIPQIVRPRLSGNVVRPKIIEPKSSVWALEFRGGPDYVALLNNLFESQGIGSLFARVRLDTHVGQNIVFSSSVEEVQANILQFYILDIAGGHFMGVQHIDSLTPNQNFVVYGDTDLQTGVDYDLLWVQDGVAFKLYVDGNLESLTPLGNGNTGNWFGALPSGFHKCNVGKRKRSEDTWYFNGLIWDVAEWNYALNANEAKNLSERVLRPDEIPGLAAWWRFQEGFGQANNRRIRDWSNLGSLAGAMLGFSGASPWTNIGVK